MLSTIINVIKDMYPPNRFSPRSKKQLYWGNLSLALVPVFLGSILEDALDGEGFGYSYYWELFKDASVAAAIGFVVFFVLRFFLRIYFGRKTCREKMLLAFRAATCGDWETFAQVLPAIHASEIQGWEFSWLSKDRSLVRLTVKKFEAIQGAIAVLKAHEDALRFRHTGDFES